LCDFFFPDAGIMKTKEQLTRMVRKSEVREVPPVGTSVPLKVVNQSPRMQILALLGWASIVEMTPFNPHKVTIYTLS
jgi:hypothetical protein